MGLRIALVVAIAATAACGGGSSPTTPTTTTPPTTNPQPNPTPAPTPTTVIMDGSVRETIPTASTPVRNPTIRITSGANAGKATQGDGNGYFVLSDLTPGTFTVEVSAPDYETATSSVTRTTSGAQNFNLRPVFKTVETVHTGEISGGTTRCQTRLGSQPCVIVNVDTHHAGTLEANLDWLPTTTDLDMDLWQGNTRLANSDNINRNFETITSAVQAGTSYQIRFYYWNGSVVTRYTLRLRRPN